MKKVRKFAQGGDTEGENPNITPDVRARARMFAMMEDDPAAQAAFQRSVHRADQAAAEKLPPPSRPASAPARAPSGGSGSAPTSSSRDRSMGARTSRPTPQAYSSDDFDPNEAPADAAAAFRRSDRFSPDFAPAEAAASLNARTRNMGVEEPKPTRTPTRALPVSSFEEENARRVAKNKSAEQEREGLKSLARGIERTDKDLEEARAKPNPALRSAMGERQAKQMEEKGSIYNKDFGKPPSERDRPNYPTAERVRAEERRQMAGESARDREDMDTGIAKSKSRSGAEAKRSEAKQDRPKYPTAARLKEQRPRAFSSKIESSPRAKELAERKRRERDTARGSVQGASFKSGGVVSSASKRADGIASKGKTRGRIY